MSGNTVCCWAFGETDEASGPDRTKSDRKLSLAAPFVPDHAIPTTRTDGDNLFCHIHPCTLLELRFTERLDTYWACPDCEKEAYLKKIHGGFRELGGTTADNMRGGKWSAEQGAGALLLSTGGR
jgi:hypothetical protein